MSFGKQIAKIKERRSVAFINIVKQNEGITGVGIVLINPLTFLIEDHDFIYTEQSPEQSPSLPIRFLELIKKYLDKKPWVYHSSINYLTNFFIDDPPTATCKIDTAKWFEENLNKINDKSLSGLVKHYKVNVEEIKEALTENGVDLNLLDNHALVAVLKAALGRKGLNDLLTKERSKRGRKRDR